MKFQIVSKRTKPNLQTNLKTVDTIGNYSKIIISIKPFLVTSNWERLMV